MKGPLGTSEFKMGAAGEAGEQITERNEPWKNVTSRNVKKKKGGQYLVRPFETNSLKEGSI
jgi:hypothetical protein